MTLIQELMNQAAVGGLLNAQAIKRFTPGDHLNPIGPY